MQPITVTVLVPAESIRRLIPEVPNHPPTMTDRDVQQYCVGVLLAAMHVMGTNGGAVAREMRLLNADPDQGAAH